MSTLTESVGRLRRVAHRAGSPESTLGIDWILVVLNLFGLGGAYVDAWSHRVYGSDQTVFSEYHVTFFSAIAVMGIFLVYLWWVHVQRGYGMLQAFPQGHLLTFAGVCGFWLSGVLDQMGHWLFGFEVGIEALLSPSHVALYLSAGLMVTGTVRAYLARRVPTQERLAPMLPALFGVGYFMSIVAFGAMIFLPILEPFSMTRAGSAIFERSAQLGISAILLQTVLVVGTALWMAKRLRPPLGSFTLVFTIFGLFTAILPLSPLLLPVWIGTGAAADLLHRWLQPWPGRSLATVAFGVLLPAFLWSFFYAWIALWNVEGGLVWSGYVWMGSIVYACVLGGLLALLVEAGCQPATVSER